MKTKAKASKKKVTKKKASKKKAVKKVAKKKATAPLSEEATVALLVGSTLPELKSLFEKLMELTPCKQYQLCIFDVDNMIQNLESIETDGHEEPMRDKPLEESVQEDDFQFPESDVDIIYADEEESEEETDENA